MQWWEYFAIPDVLLYNRPWGVYSRMDTETKKYLEKLEFENALMKEVLDNIGEGVYAIDKERNILLYSGKLHQL